MKQRELLHGDLMRMLEDELRMRAHGKGHHGVYHLRLRWLRRWRWRDCGGDAASARTQGRGRRAGAASDGSRGLSVAGRR
jgi:hypothetical protein